VLFAVVRLLSLSLSLSTVADSAPLTGVVVDASGRALPRVVVQVVAADGTTAASTLTDADGTFRVNGAPPACRVDASLAGFSSESAPCQTSAPVRLTLQVAPVAEAIVVSATRTEAPAGQVASAMTVFDGAEIARKQQPLLSDLLRDAPGTTVVATGTPGSLTSMFVRGGESNYTKVLLDGVPLNEPGGAFNLSNVTTENLDRVEMVRGANSALFGSDAMTGVVQLFTRRGTTPRPEVRLGLEGGNFSTARASAGVSGRSGGADYSIDAADITTDNNVPNSAFDNLTLSGSGGATLGHGTTLGGVVRLERGKTGTPGATAFGRPDLDAFFERHDGVWGVTFDQTTGALHQRATYGDAISHQASTNLHEDPPYTPTYGGSTAPFAFSDFTYDERTDLTRHHAGYQFDGTISTAHAGTHVETAVVDWDGERATLRDALAGTSQPASRDNVGLSLQHQALWSRVFVTGGVRFEHNASFGNATVPRVAAAWYLHTGTDTFGTTRVHGTAGLGIKEPTILQSYSTNPYYLGNPDLQPEKSRAVDLGVEQRLAHDRVRVDLTWFDNRYRNIIALGQSDPTTFYSQYMNIGLTRARGAELSGDVALVSGFHAKGGYTFLDSEILESTSDFSEVYKVGNSALRRPRHSGFVDLAWTGGRATVSVNGSFVGERSDSDFSSLFPPILVNGAYADWDLRASARVTGALSVTGSIDNLFDSDHMEPLGYPVLGRAARVGVRVRF
jgi:outer membrane cobalamin receptor